MTLNLSEAKNHGCRPHRRGSVRRASGFVLTGYSDPIVATPRRSLIGGLLSRPTTRFWILTADCKNTARRIALVACRDPSTCASIRRNRHELVVGIAWDSFLSGRRLIRWRGCWATQTF